MLSPRTVAGLLTLQLGLLSSLRTGWDSRRSRNRGSTWRRMRKCRFSAWSKSCRHFKCQYIYVDREMPTERMMIYHSHMESLETSHETRPPRDETSRPKPVSSRDVSSTSLVTICWSQSVSTMFSQDGVIHTFWKGVKCTFAPLEGKVCSKMHHRRLLSCWFTQQPRHDSINKCDHAHITTVPVAERLLKKNLQQQLQSY
jgi:hypothetical protein